LATIGIAKVSLGGLFEAGRFFAAAALIISLTMASDKSPLTGNIVCK
jgi:hypothetical protein